MNSSAVSAATQAAASCMPSTVTCTARQPRQLAAVSKAAERPNLSVAARVSQVAPVGWVLAGFWPNRRNMPVGERGAFAEPETVSLAVTGAHCMQSPLAKPGSSRTGLASARAPRRSNFDPWRRRHAGVSIHPSPTPRPGHAWTRRRHTGNTIAGQARLRWS